MHRPLLTLLVLALLLPAAAAGQAIVQTPVQTPVATPLPPVVVTPSPSPGFIRGVDFSVKTPGAVVQDPQALTGVAWALLQNGFISHSFTAQPGSYVATVRAVGDPAGGVGPHMVLLVDGVPLAAWEVPPQWTTFQVAFALGGGQPHAVTLAYTNDAQVAVPTPGGGSIIDDRNLIVDWLALSPLPPAIVLPVPLTPIVATTVQVAPFVGVLQIPVVPAELAPRVIVVPTFQAGQAVAQVNVVSVTQLTQVQQQTLVNNIVNTIVNNVNVNVQNVQNQVTVNQPPGVIPGATPQQRQVAIQQGGNVIVQTAQGPQALNQAAIVQNVGGDAQVTIQGETGAGGITGQPQAGPQAVPQPTATAQGGEEVAGVLTVEPGGAIDISEAVIAPGAPTVGATGANGTSPVAPAVGPGVGNLTNVTPGAPGVTPTITPNVTPTGGAAAPAGGAGPAFDLANATVLACDDGSPGLSALDGQCLVRSPVPPGAAGGRGGLDASALNLTLVDPQNLTAAGLPTEGAAQVECRGSQCTLAEPLASPQCPDCALIADLVVQPGAGLVQPVEVAVRPGGAALGGSGGGGG